ncbi:probable dolichyl pyrophosphate Glc1Man9GlcNAc2 alpha-1,3-glucosyltransferase [Sitodiplosis mosellana]|uniref:probable dolichyl pyrophosphate Glc1Man9GlcNAc2 alpha-1,3-glucosyltransferase n=1 Tax=Sitodiplosis mosellana TaxID=263140 RepID=UPI002444B14E|nr:probable dolichyl pyrophosphate Glc1Man9GlcNAc2 alpha-1,3-glucosyltransferase [Sitodiplosis mosellana]
MFWSIFGLITGIKLLFLPAYRSTDFEVHRNWLAITHSLPISKWYVEDTSEWTLDYPPIFAYFEFILSHFAKYFDANMLKVDNLNYDSDKTVLFQRLSVVVTDVVYAIGVKRCLTQLSPTASKQRILCVVLLSNFGLLIIDHIHFQYNGILFGILLLSIAYMCEEKFLKSAFCFAVLLNMKHIFVYVSPVYIVYLLKVYCWHSPSMKTTVLNLIKLAIVTLGVTAASFGPFIHQMPQVLSRLFPFKRGLCHAYWAPNFWAIYNMADKVASVGTNKGSNSSNTGGLVQEYSHQVLPVIQPHTTFIITLLAMVPCIVKIAFGSYNKAINKVDFVRGIVICGCTSFLFGWHVHEKAILMTVIPLSILMAVSDDEAKNIWFLSIVSHFSLFPLLFKSNLVVIKIGLLVTHTLIITNSLRSLWPSVSRKIVPIHELLYSVGLFGILFYEFCIQYLLNLDKRLPFLPLLLTSVYCSIGIIYFWLKYYAKFLFKISSSKKVRKD